MYMYQESYNNTIAANAVVPWVAYQGINGSLRSIMKDYNYPCILIVEKW